MNDPDPTLQDQIDALFEQAQQGDEMTQELARDCLNHFRHACREALDWQRQEGRELVTSGQSPEEVRRQAEARVDAARVRLHERLVALLNWARGQGRLADSKDRADFD